ncbi:glycosyltransferase [Microbacteriaceae bacterium VKM Ac-2855]|nr:glycosyltransferase [Microbacteriaceae bacterium VKM Ac-2855]
MTANAVTVVVPVYGGVERTLDCIRSVIDTVDLDLNRLLVVNDLGPEAELIEREVLAALEGVDGARYERNPRNLGFVATCNRAVRVLDSTANDILLLNSDTVLSPGALSEMAAVLAAAEKHAVVCPRSNDATIASIPFLRRTAEAPRPAERSREVFAALAAELPRWNVAPVAVGFAFLVRRSVVRGHGLFDEIFSPGYDEENDFCLRVNALGWSAVIANRAFVTHASSSSFGDARRRALQRAHGAELERRYPFYPEIVTHYIGAPVDAVDHFADVLVEDRGARGSLLVDVHHLSAHYDGTTRNALTFLDLLAERRASLDVDVSIRSSRESIEFFDLARFGFPVLENGDTSRVFDAVFSLSPVTTVEALLAAATAAPRWMTSHLDVIALRTWNLRMSGFARARIVRDSLELADRVVAISRATVDDSRAYFGDLALEESRVRVIAQGAADTAFPPRADDVGLADLDADTRQVIEAGGFVIVMGNGFPHKQVQRALEALHGLDRPVLAFGSRASAGVHDANVHRLPTGALSDELIGQLLRRAGAMVFPTSYEGFGLPVAEAAAVGLPVVAYRSAALVETVAALEVADAVSFVDDFHSLGTVVSRVAAAGTERAPREIRTMRRYNEALLAEFIELASTPVDRDRLRRRWSAVSAIADYSAASERRARESDARADQALALLAATRATRSFRATQRVVVALGPLRPVLRALRARRR